MLNLFIIKNIKLSYKFSFIIKNNLFKFANQKNYIVFFYI